MIQRVVVTGQVLNAIGAKIKSRTFARAKPEPAAGLSKPVLSLPKEAGMSGE